VDCKPMLNQIAGWVKRRATRGVATAGLHFVQPNLRGYLVLIFFTGFVVCAAQKAHALEQKDTLQPQDGMVLIPAGKFMMGSAGGDPDERPVHEVELKAFFMEVHEVTNSLYKKFADATGNPLPAFWQPQLDKPDDPVVGVSWYDAQAYAAWAGKRLPTEAEWEYAARGGKSTGNYPWGDRPDSGAANFHSFGIAPVKSYPSNGYGLYDMTGNVWEWCADWYGNEYYAASSRKNPSGPPEDAKKVLRGGAWYCNANEVRTANRFYATPDAKSFNAGFRCAKDSSH